MPNNRLVRDSNSAELKGTRKNQKKSGPKVEPPKAEPIQVTHGNAPLLTVKYQELILAELRRLNKHFEEAKLNG